MTGFAINAITKNDAKTSYKLAKELAVAITDVLMVITERHSANNKIAIMKRGNQKIEQIDDYKNISKLTGFTRYELIEFLEKYFDREDSPLAQSNNIEAFIEGLEDV